MCNLYHSFELLIFRKLEKHIHDEELSDIKCHENPLSGSQVVMDGQTNRHGEENWHSCATSSCERA